MSSRNIILRFTADTKQARRDLKQLVKRQRQIIKWNEARSK